MTSIHLKDVNVSYIINNSGNTKTTKIDALKNVSLVLNNNDRVGIIGRNGGGKSTLLGILSETISPQAGTIDIQGERLSLLNRMTGLIPSATLYQNAKIKAFSLGLKNKAATEFTNSILKEAKLEKRSESSLRSLSTGMSGRFNIALNSQIVKPITILDEWVGTLESPNSSKNNLLERLINDTEIVVLASHNEQLIRELCNRVILLEQGEIIYNGHDLDQGFDMFSYIKSSINKKEVSTNSLITSLTEIGLPSEQDAPEKKPRNNKGEKNRDKVHFINVGRTSIPSISKTLDEFISPRYSPVFHNASRTLDSIPYGEKICILYRDPINRFVSGFLSRQLKGKPLFNIPWSTDEEKIFSWFASPNELAEALSAKSPETQYKAFFALTNMTFLKSSYAHYFKSKAIFESRKNDILLTGNMDNSKETISNLFKRLELDQAAITNFVDSDELLVSQSNTEMSDVAIKNIRHWYEQDFDYFNLLENVK